MKISKQYEEETSGNFRTKNTKTEMTSADGINSRWRRQRKRSMNSLHECLNKKLQS